MHDTSIKNKYLLGFGMNVTNGTSATSVTGATENTDKNTDNEAGKKIDDADSIDRALDQMSSIYKSRCIQPQNGSNVTIREIKKKE